MPPQSALPDGLPAPARSRAMLVIILGLTVAVTELLLNLQTPPQ